MKTLAIRLEDETHALLSLVAQFEDKPLVGVIREAIESFLQDKAQGGALAEKAQAALADIDREAAAKKAAIEQMLGSKPEEPATPRRGGRQRNT